MFQVQKIHLNTSASARRARASSSQISVSSVLWCDRCAVFGFNPPKPSNKNSRQKNLTSRSMTPKPNRFFLLNTCIHYKGSIQTIKLTAWTISKPSQLPWKGARSILQQQYSHLLQCAFLSYQSVYETTASYCTFHLVKFIIFHQASSWRKTWTLIIPSKFVNMSTCHGSITGSIPIYLADCLL